MGARSCGPSRPLVPAFLDFFFAFLYKMFFAFSYTLAFLFRVAMLMQLRLKYATLGGGGLVSSECRHLGVLPWGGGEGYNQIILNY